MKVTDEPVGLELQAHQGDCRDIGFPVGKLWLSYVNGQINATYDMEQGFVIKDTHFFVGGRRRRLPRVRIDHTRQEVYDPEYFPYSHDLSQVGGVPGANGAANDTYVIDFDDSNVYVIAHATVCGDFDKRRADVYASEDAAEDAHEASLSCVGEVEVINDDFEDGLVDGWYNGVLMALDDYSTDVKMKTNPDGYSIDTPTGGHFLGKLSNGSPPLFQDLIIPGGTKYVLIRLDVYQFGDWEPEDSLVVKLKRTLMNSDAETIGSSQLRSAGPYTARVPRQYFGVGDQSGDKLQIGFEFVTTSNSARERSAGVDNIVVTAYGKICHIRNEAPGAEILQPKPVSS